MELNWKSSRLNIAVAVFMLSAANFGLAQNHTAAKNKEARVQVSNSVDDKDAAYYLQFLDKDGGYKDRKGCYYNPKAGTYTDETGGVVDNWGGYTYKDGSYKSRLGDYYDSKENVFKLSNGETAKLDPGFKPAEARQLLRENVEQNDGYDKDLTRRSMMQQIKLEHPKPSRQ